MAGAIIGQVAGKASDTIGGIASAALSIKASQKAWDRQRKVLQNQIQWRVADLKAAGLNPILAANSGLGAGGAPAPVQPNIPDFGASASRGIKTASEKSLRESQKNTNSAQASALDAQTGLSHEKSRTEQVQQRALLAGIQQATSNSRNMDSLRHLNEARLPMESFKASLAMDPRFRGVLIGREMFGQGLSSGVASGAAGLISNVKDMIQGSK
nr:MAG: DNA pilot protein [Microvirus sp.]